MLIPLLFALGLDEPVKATTPATPAVVTAAPVPVAPETVPAAPSTPSPAKAESSGPPASPAGEPQRLFIRPLAPDPFADVRFVWRDHPSIRARDLFRIDFTAKFQLDTRDPGDEPTDFDTVEVHRMRVGIEGNLFNHWEYSVERELTENELGDPAAESTKSAWKDVYLEANYTSKAQVRGGKFKVPYGLDQTSGESNLDFVYRSLGGRYLSPGRDIGGMVHGRFLNRSLNYWVGVFEHDGDNARASKIQGGDTTGAVRITVVPFRAQKAAYLHSLDISGSYALSQLSNDESVYPNGLRGRTVMSQYTFFEPMFVHGHRSRYGADLDWTAGPFGARAEYMFVSDTREHQGIGDETLNPARGKAWYALATWVVTGEQKTRPVEPRHGGLLRGGIGAIELAGRYDRLWFDSKPGEDPPFRNSRATTIYPNGDRVLTLGVNYYANRWVKVQFNGIREDVEDIERSPVPDGKAFWSTVLRLQLEL